LLAIINPMAIANVPSVHGKICGNRVGARKLTVRVVGAVTVRVAVPAFVTEVGDTVHVVPGKLEGTLQASETVPVNPFSAAIVRVDVATLAVVPAVKLRLAGERLG
jgi:hypothetical protein